MNVHLQGAGRTPPRAPSLPRRRGSDRRGFVKGFGAAVVYSGWTMLLAVMAISAILATLEIPRNALWTVVRTCVAMSDELGTPFPCLKVKNGPQGFAVLRAPGSRTHLIVTPTVPLSGLESPALWSSATPYWQAALDARDMVIEGAGEGRLRLGDIALAINSRRSRSQDHLHIHADCAAPQLLHDLRLRAATIGPTWSPLPDTISEATYWVRRAARSSAAGRDAFVSLRGLPNDLHPDSLTVGAINLSADGNGDFVQLVSADIASSAEDLLDISCIASLAK